jgi:hypothetical protein
MAHVLKILYRSNGYSAPRIEEKQVLVLPPVIRYVHGREI